MTEQAGFAQNLLRGKEEIAEFLFGDQKLRRQVYQLRCNVDASDL
jgi:hypothetical protein